MTPDEFLKDGNAQEAVFKAKFGQLEAKYGREGAARAWFAGEGGMNNLNAKDVNGMTVGRYGTLASNPKVVSARVEVEQYLIEKERGNTRWAWANQDHDWAVQQRQRALVTQQREDQRWEREQQTMSREEKTRSITTQIITSTLADPENAYAANKDRFRQLAEIDPKAAESGAAFVDAFTQRRERVPDSVERPVLAQLQQDMVRSAGDPAKQRDLILQALQLFSAGKISRDSMGRFVDDAQRFGQWDPETQRKLQDPQVVRVRQAASQLFTEKGATSVYGSAAIDVLVTEQVIDKAVIEHLKVKPNATPEELAATATKALQGVLPTIAPNVLGSGRAEDIRTKVPQAQQNLQVQQPPSSDTPPADRQTSPVGPKPTAEQAAPLVKPEDAQAFIQSLTEAQARGGLPAMMKAIADFDAAMGIPGLGQKLIDLHAKPPAATAPKKK